MLIELIKSFSIDFCAVSEDNVTDIVFMLPYSPFENYPKNCARIDAFYITSNTLYNKVKEIKQVLIDNGYTIVDRHLQLKKVAQVGGLGRILNNQLLVNKKYGSRTTLQSISVASEYEYFADGKVDKICDSCHKCDTACPTNALCKGEFKRENCLRHKQDFCENYFDDNVGRTLGCEECQNICPYNSNVLKVQMPKAIAELFDYSNIFKMLLGGRKALKPLADLIGSNMARPTFLFNLVVNSLIASKNFDYTEQIKLFQSHQSESIRRKANFYLNVVNK